MQPNPTRAPDTASSGALWILGAPALALAATFVLLLAGAPGDWIGAAWLVAVLWTIAASLVQALWAGIPPRRLVGSFTCAELPCAELPCAASSDDDDGDFATRTGAYAHLRVRAQHEALTREGGGFPDDHGRSGPSP